MRAGLVAALLAAAGTQAQDAAPHYRAGQELLARGSYRQAAAELRQATAADSTSTEAFLALGQACAVLEDYPGAIAAYERAARLGAPPEHVGPELATLYYKLGLTQYQQRRYEEAVTSFGRTLEHRPADARARYATGLCQWALRRNAEAQQSLEGAIAADSAYTHAYKALGDLQRAGGQYAPAARMYQKAIELDSTYMEAYGGLAQVQLETSEPEGTVSLMRRAVRIAPQYADGYLLLGAALNRLGRQHEAVEPLERAVELAPRDPEARYRLAEALYGKGDDGKALEQGQQAVALRRGFHAAEVLLGDICQKLGRTSEARSWYTRGMQDPSLREYAQNRLRQLDRGTGRR